MVSYCQLFSFFIIPQYFIGLHHQQSDIAWCLFNMHELYPFRSVSLLSKTFRLFFAFAFVACEKRKTQIADSRNNKNCQVTTMFRILCVLVFSCVLYLFMFHVKFCVYVQLDRFVSNLKQTKNHSKTEAVLNTLLSLKRIIYGQDCFRGFATYLSVFPMLTHLVRLRFLAHLALMPMSLSNHELSVMCWHPVSSSLALSVDSHPSYRFGHRNFISCTWLHICP